MTFKFLWIFYLFSTCFMTTVHASECYAKFLEKISLDECSLLFDGTLTVHFKDFVDKPECLNKKTAIGFKLNQQQYDDWDQIQYPHPNSAVTFTTSEHLCQRVNVTVSLNFVGKPLNSEFETFVSKPVNSEMNPEICIRQNLSDNEKSLIKTKCPNLKALLTTTTTTTTTTTSTTTTTTTTTTTAAGERNIISIALEQCS